MLSPRTQRISFCLGLLLLAAAPLTAQPGGNLRFEPGAVESANAASPTAPLGREADAPQIHAEKTHLDLGTVNEGEKVEFAFPIVNLGRDTLRILQVQKSCGCTEATAEKHILQPGESTQITGQFDSHGRRGMQHKIITVSSNDPKNPSLQLTFNVNVSQTVLVEPERVSWGRISVEEATTQTVTIRSASAEPLEIKEVTVDGPAAERIWARLIDVRPTPAPAGQLDGETSTTTEARIAVGIKPGGETGTLQGRVLVRTNLEQQPVVEIPVLGLITVPYVVSPTILFFGVMAPATTVERTLVLQSMDGEPFEIERVDMSGLPIEWKLIEQTEDVSTPDRDPRSIKRLQFSFTAPEDFEGLEDEIQIITDREGNNIIPVRTIARSAKPGEMLDDALGGE
ncbi:MAG TPA: DUF1573 domain-containing protein [Candidatus Sumerlaeota bacterium]|mgnify:CR=1 FL=1|nr:DUF1573 domain-containing protein [Candidatus Sumerlaeota bacterium]HOR29656.1 DUF1573 domain-containing protein [Candidatus Sumerlaeota bacterium]